MQCNPFTMNRTGLKKGAPPNPCMIVVFGASGKDRVPRSRYVSQQRFGLLGTTGSRGVVATRGARMGRALMLRSEYGS